MKQVLIKIKEIPLDIKLFNFGCLLIPGILFFPDEPSNITLFATYIVFCLVNCTISGFFMTYVGDSKYNYIRNATGIKQIGITVTIYITICLVISYILAVTEWILFLFSGYN